MDFYNHVIPIASSLECKLQQMSDGRVVEGGRKNPSEKKRIFQNLYWEKTFETFYKRKPWGKL